MRFVEFWLTYTPFKRHSIYLYARNRVHLQHLIDPREVAMDGSLTGPVANEDSSSAKGSSSSAANQEVGKNVLVKAALDKMKELKSANDSKSMPTGEELREDPESKLKSDHRTEASGESNKGRDRDREKERTKSRDHDRGRESDRERGREDSERDRDKIKERGHRSRDKGKDSGRFEKSKHHSSRDREYYSSSSSSREKDCCKHHSYA